MQIFTTIPYHIAVTNALGVEKKCTKRVHVSQWQKSHYCRYNQAHM